MRVAFVGLLGLAGCGASHRAGSSSDAAPHDASFADTGTGEDAGGGPDPCADGGDRDADGHARPDCGGDDCDDSNVDIPSPDDSVGDGIDQNCDGADGVDADGDGHASAESGGDDCDEADRTIHPGAEEPGPEWTVETVDEDGAVPALTIDPNGRAHIAYINTGLRHAFRSDDGWELETVDDQGGGRPAIAVDTDAAVHILYDVPEAASLGYASHAGSGWILGVVDSVDYEGSWPSLTIDRKGTLHASYLAPTGSGYVLDFELRYGVLEEDGWRTSVVRGGAWLRPTSIAVGPDDSIRIDWVDEFDIVHDVLGPAGWEGTQLWYGADDVALAVDADGYDHLAFGTQGDVRCGNDVGGEWSYDILEPYDMFIQDVSISLDAEGVSHLAWAVGDFMYYGTNVGGAWTSEVVDDVAGDIVGAFGASIALGPGTIQIATSGYDYELEDTVLHRVIRGVADGVDRDCDGDEF